MSEKKQNNLHLTVGPEDSVSFGQATMLGIQHVLAMDVYVVPVIIASIIGISTAQTSSLIQATFIAAGLATIIQSHFCMRLPVAQGPSFIPIGAIAGIYFANNQQGNGWGAVLGASYHAKGELGQNILLAFIAAGTLIFFALLGSALKKGRIFRVSSVILALLFGSIAAQLLRVLDLSAVSEAAWFSLPQLPLVNFSFQFDWSAIATMLVIYLVLMAETTGTWFAVSHVVAEPLTEEKINRGVIGEGLGCLVSSFIGGTPVTSYSTNAGIISITGVASRKVFVAAGAWFVLFGLSGKLSTLIAAIPAPVIGGVFVVVCGIISVSGMKVMSDVTIHEKEMYVIAVPIIMTLALTLLPKEFLETLPQFLQYLFSSPVATASIVAILLQAILPNVQEG